MKVLGIDYGDFNIGLAIYDKDVDFIYPLKTLVRKKANVLRKSIREIVDIVKDENINEIVVGNPINMDDTLGDRVIKVGNFIHMLENKLKTLGYEYKIILQDERLTTIKAKEILKERGIREKDLKKNLDQVAAEIILSDYKNMKGKGE